MLFSLVYTWIKYKMSPPSVTTLNRLIVERDSKHRRITSNLGLTFRNSKWSSYARSNINVNAKNDLIAFLSRLSLVIALILFVTLFAIFYNPTTGASPLSSIYWFMIDSNIYFQLCLSSGLLYILQTSVYYFHDSFILLLLPNRAPVRDFASHSNDTDMRIPRRLYKPALYALLSHSTLSSRLDDLFANGRATTSPFSNLLFLKSLYKSSHFVTLSKVTCPSFDLIAFDLINSIRTDKTHLAASPWNIFVRTTRLRQPSFNSLLLDYAVFSVSKANADKLISSSPRWTLQQLTANTSATPFENNSIKGLFYLPTATQTRLTLSTTLYPELVSVSLAPETQSNLIRWERWLYRYSLLHRSSLKSSYYLNAFKRSLSSGFYNEHMGTRNLWLPSTFTNDSENGIRSQAGPLYSTLYGSSFASPTARYLTPVSNFLNTSTLLNHSFYETSYHWYLGRFYSLNSSQSNSFTTQPSLHTNVMGETKFSPFTAKLFSSAITYARADVNSSTLNSINNILPSSPSLSEDSTGRSSSSDVFLSYNLNSFLTKERLELLYTLSQNKSNLQARHNSQNTVDTRLLKYDDVKLCSSKLTRNN